MVRITLLIGLALASAACTSPPEQREPEPAPARAANPESIAVDLLFAQVVEEDPAVDTLLDFVADDDARDAQGGRIELTEHLGSKGPERVLSSTDRAALSGYLDSVFSRRPELKLPSELELAFGTAPTPSASAGDPTTVVRVYWLKRSSRVAVSQVRDVTIKQEHTGQEVFVLTFENADKEAFGRLTTTALEHKIAIVVGGDVISAPIVREPITEGVVHISTGAMNSEGPGSAQALGRSLFGEQWVHLQAARNEDSIGGLRWLWKQTESP